jgi:23S rRNA (uracil1939-C5)-methyltransferase
MAEIQKKKGTYFGTVTKILDASKNRISPKEAHFTSCSPWQILDPYLEASEKKQMVSELFSRNFKISLPKWELIDAPEYYGYRNKMEYSFWADDDGLSFAFFTRGGQGKYKADSCLLAKNNLNLVANSTLKVLNKHGIEGRALKSLIVRENINGKVIAALFVKNENFPELDFKTVGSIGFEVYYSDPKSPMSRPDKLLYKNNDAIFTEQIGGRKFGVNVLSFAQVNIPMFEQALSQISKQVDNDDIIDFYAGSGAIGLSVKANSILLIEENKQAVIEGNNNIVLNKIANAKFVCERSEKMIEHITKDKTIILDPPRAGLHQKITDTLNEALPPKIIYLSCNPATQARDISTLLANYNITFFEGYNFFPRTPHIETLAVLSKK